ncbi:hypothetical protein [Brachybacterium phenoliresistens]|uniref:hypothetical protein n=1 Tax=Brachybacterium phenoliresistens TaxID=396014 RepID=UPI0031D302C2
MDPHRRNPLAPTPPSAPGADAGPGTVPAPAGQAAGTRRWLRATIGLGVLLVLASGWQLIGSLVIGPMLYTSAAGMRSIQVLSVVSSFLGSFPLAVAGAAAAVSALGLHARAPRGAMGAVVAIVLAVLAADLLPTLLTGIIHLLPAGGGDRPASLLPTILRVLALGIPVLVAAAGFAVAVVLALRAVRAPQRQAEGSGAPRGQVPAASRRSARAAAIAVTAIAILMVLTTVWVLVVRLPAAWDLLVGEPSGLLIARIQLASLVAGAPSALAHGALLIALGSLIGRVGEDGRRPAWIAVLVAAGAGVVAVAVTQLIALAGAAAQVAGYAVANLLANSSSVLLWLLAATAVVVLSWSAARRS